MQLMQKEAGANSSQYVAVSLMAIDSLDVCIACAAIRWIAARPRKGQPSTEPQNGQGRDEGLEWPGIGAEARHPRPRRSNNANPTKSQISPKHQKGDPDHNSVPIQRALSVASPDVAIVLGHTRPLSSVAPDGSSSRASSRTILGLTGSLILASDSQVAAHAARCRRPVSPAHALITCQPMPSDLSRGSSSIISLSCSARSAKNAPHLNNHCLWSLASLPFALLTGSEH